MNALGYKYDHGTGVAQDLALAVHWYCKAVEAGNSRGMNNLALLLHAGRGVPHDREQARDLWRQSADLGHTNAMANLGSSYFEEPSPDRQLAMAWLLKAAQAGNPDAQKLLCDNGYGLPTPPPVDQAAKMIPWTKRASGHAHICAETIS